MTLGVKFLVIVHDCDVDLELDRDRLPVAVRVAWEIVTLGDQEVLLVKLTLTVFWQQ